MKPYGTVRRDLLEDDALRIGNYERYGHPNKRGYESSSRRYKHRARQKAQNSIRKEMNVYWLQYLLDWLYQSYCCQVILSYFGM